ncbi:MAG: hypothetical protein R2734_01105 [Nocardioides sp.]
MDPFDLPDWLGSDLVTRHSASGVAGSHLVPGRLSGDTPDKVLPCDLVAVDEAYPAPVADDDVRTRAHQAWRHGQVLLLEVTGRLTLGVPGRDFGPDRVMEALARLARAVGARPDNYSVLLRLGRAAPDAR